MSRCTRLLALAACALWACGDDQSQEGGHHGGRHEEHQRGHTRESVVQISQAALERSAIRVEEAREMALGGGVRVPAEVAPEPDRVVHVAPLVEGQIAEVHASVGDRVEAGETLAVLRSIALGETRAAMSEAQAELSVAQANYDRERELVEEGIGAQRNLVEAEGALRTARARVEGLRSRTRVYGRGGSGATTLLRSTIAGEVVQRHATVGEVVGPDRNLFVIADTSLVWVVGSVYPQDVGAVEEGAQVTFVTPDMPGETFRGPLDWVSPMIDEETRTLPIRLVLDNAEGRLRPGSFGTLLVPRGADRTAVTVADTGVEEVAGAEVVFVPTDMEGAFEVRPVTTGRREEGRVEILEGLDDGEPYVADGVFVLKSQLLRGELGEGHAH